MPVDAEEQEDLESVFDEDTGETMLYRIEAKQGKKVRARVGVRPDGKSGGRDERLCYRCGRPGHIGRDCRA
eukprot:8403634-Lingulodinium_polyedra.AAC.1